MYINIKWSELYLSYCKAFSPEELSCLKDYKVIKCLAIIWDVCDVCSIPRQRGDLSPLFNAEAPQAVAPAQNREALVGDAGSARHEL